MRNKTIEPTYRSYIEQAIEGLQHALDHDTHDWTSKYASTFLSVSIDYINKAETFIK